VSPQAEITVTPLAGTNLEFQWAKTKTQTTVTFRTTNSMSYIARFSIHTDDAEALERLVADGAAPAGRQDCDDCGTRGYTLILHENATHPCAVPCAPCDGIGHVPEKTE